MQQSAHEVPRICQDIRLSKPLAGLFLLLICGLLGADALLLRRCRDLAARPGAASAFTAVGMTVPPLDGVTVGGRPVRVDYSAEPRSTLLLVFSTECHFCEQNWPQWEALAARIDRREYRLVYANLSHSLTSEYIERRRLSADIVLAQVDPNSVIAYGLGPTPAALLVGPDGRVQKAWYGALKDAGLEAMQQTLETLPHRASELPR
jgi:hypothetical protein